MGAVFPFLFVTQPLHLNRQVLRLYHVTFLALVLPTSTTQTRTRNVDSSEIPFRETLLDHCRLYYSLAEGEEEETTALNHHQSTTPTPPKAPSGGPKPVPPGRLFSSMLSTI